MIKYLIPLLLTACTTVQVPQQKDNSDDLKNIRKELGELSHYVFAQAYIDAIHGCEIAGRICTLQHQADCREKTEQCVVLNYRQWESVKKQQGYK